MATLAESLELVTVALEKASGVKIKREDAVTEFYHFSSKIREQRKLKGTKYRTAVDDLRLRAERDQTLYGLPVQRTVRWADLLGVYVNDEGKDALQIFESSILSLELLDPEEEFLRNYDSRIDHNYSSFVQMRAEQEMQIYGDTPIIYWIAMIETLSQHFQFLPLGLSLLRALVSKYGSLFHQNVRDLSKIRDFTPTFTTPLITEMCIAESILEFNLLFRFEDERIDRFTFGAKKISPFSLLREFFLICLPHPKRVNNMLRAPYSWFVKSWGIAVERVWVLNSRASDDRNSKDVIYTGYSRTTNIYSNMIMQSVFHDKSLKQNIEKIKQTEDYVMSIIGYRVELKYFGAMLDKVYITEFDPRDVSQVMLASHLLAIQVITGYGRAWVKNEGSKVDDQKKDSAENFIRRVSEYTSQNFIKAYDEALQDGETIVRPHEVYGSMLRLAKNTSSGFSAEISVQKRYGPKASRRDEIVKIKSRIKALVIFLKGHEMFTEKSLRTKYNTVELYQIKGSRDVPIKSTRTIFAINLAVLVPQLILTLPLNEYFAKVGGITAPWHGKLSGKLIIGDLEATGSRVMDACDTFRNSADANILTIAIDYSEYDAHMTPHNFRKGMVEGIRSAMKRYSHYRYLGFTLDEIIDAAYGEGRVINTLWDGKRKIYIVSRDKYLSLYHDKKPEGNFKNAKGTYPMLHSDLSLLKPEKGHELILASCVDGHDLAMINTHLSGENSTLIANSMHNMAIGRIMQEEVSKGGGAIEFLSEQYVGDDTLFYSRMRTLDVEKFNTAITTMFAAIEKCGHEVSESKTLIAPFSVEKTQTHAKQGVYIPQDRMMIVSSERRKDIEDVQGYMRSQIQTMCTKCSRGFSDRLAMIILMLKGAVVGMRKFKSTIKEAGKYRPRKFDDDVEDGYTLAWIRHPGTLFIPIAWNGYGCHPLAVNLVMTPEIFIDSCSMIKDRVMDVLIGLIGRSPPHWNETQADKRQIRAVEPNSFFQKMARPAVYQTLMDPRLMQEVEKLPLGDYAPNRVATTMMHSALLKEKSARVLLSAGYEEEFRDALNGWTPLPVTFNCGSMELTTLYAKIFDVRSEEVPIRSSEFFPDVNLPPSFRLQKMMIGHRASTRVRMSYVDKIDSILRGDTIMRGFITANTIISILEKIGLAHESTDLKTLFELLNIEPRVAERLAEYIASERIRFDGLQVAKGGIGGDEFSMSLDILTEEMSDRFISTPHQFTKTEVDVIRLYVSQRLMLDVLCGKHLKRYTFSVSQNSKVRYKQRMLRLRMFTPRLRRIRHLLDVTRMSARMVEQQFL
uniref:RNA-directed RNA polymerase n=1 Tax=Ife virus TaxID=2547357 RepID=A0A482A631_9REOV|nr:VP1 [Ife virus]